MPEYAALKAIGYSNRYLLGVVFQEAIISALSGFVPGCLLSAGLYKITTNATGLLLMMTCERILQVLTLKIALVRYIRCDRCAEAKIGRSRRCFLGAISYFDAIVKNLDALILILVV